MKKVIKISTHSFVDLITNSSSELFVCNGDKSVETVKEIVNQIFKEGLSEELLDEWDREEAVKHKGTSPDVIWGTFFSEDIVVADRDFDIHNYPNHDELKEVGMGVYNREYWDQYHERSTREREIVRKKVGEEPYKDLPYDKRREKPKWKLWSKKFDDIMRELIMKRSKEEREIREKISNYFDLPENLEYCIDWNIPFKEGDIFLSSAEDNSVPYTYWDKINESLSATNYHLG